MLHEKSGVVLRCANTPVSYKKDNAGNLTQTGRRDQHGRSSGRSSVAVTHHYSSYKLKL